VRFSLCGQCANVKGGVLSPTARIERSLFHRGGSASTRDNPAPTSGPVFLSFSNLARRDLTGGADLEAPTFLHFLPPLGRCSILGPGQGGSQSVVRAPLGYRSC
jgi:hypothetical protein